MSLHKKITIDIFCSVIDNFGDIGVCLRLAKELTLQNCNIHLYCNDLHSLKKICNKINPYIKIQKFNKNLHIHKWLSNDNKYTPSEVIIEAFGCNIEKSYINKLTEKNIWINLEYLSAESWIEECHKLPSLQNNNLQKFFFFPGFTSKTGGLNYEYKFFDLNFERARDIIFKQLKLPDIYKNYFITLVFAYQNENLIPLLESISKIKKKVIFLLPCSLSTECLENHKCFSKLKEQNSDVKCVKFKMIDQNIFNYFIKGVDLNIIRGEDTLTQAVMSGKPCLWDIYKQDDDAHLNKLDSFLRIYTESMDSDIKDIVSDVFYYFNINYSNDTDYELIYTKFKHYMLEYDKICKYSQMLSVKLNFNHNLSSNLLNFIKNKLS